MKTLLRLLFILSVGVVSTACAAVAEETANRTPEELEKLVSPIALYPDSLIALILPASTESADVVLAARFLSFEGKESDIEKQFWHDSVKSLAHYPELVRWMDENLDWTQQLGDAFAAQPADVMAAIQRLRAHARADGLLTDTPEQRVVVEKEVVYIVPANPACIYIPRYDPDILWSRAAYRGSFLSFSVGFSVGNWLFYDCDWPGRTIWIHRRHPGWAYMPFWRPPPPAVRVNVVTAWRPPVRYSYHGYAHHNRAPVHVVIPPPCGPARPNYTYHNRDNDPRRNRPVPPSYHRAPTPSHSGVAHVSPVTPVPPMTHVGVAPSIPRQPAPPLVAGPRPNHNPNRMTPPAPPAHTPNSRPPSASPRPSAGSATATLHRPAPPPAPAPAGPRATAPSPAPASAPRPASPPSGNFVPRPSAAPRPSAPPAPSQTAPAPARENKSNSGNSGNNSDNNNDNNGRNSRRGH